MEIRTRRAVKDQHALREGPQIRVVGTRTSERRAKGWLHWFTRLLAMLRFTTLTS